MPSKRPPVKFPKVSAAAKKSMIGNKNSVGNKGGGRESLYKPQYAKQAFNLALLGATDEDLGRSFDVTATTIIKWRKTFPDFDSALRAGKEEADAKVVASLFERATGYKHKSKKIFQNNGRIIEAPFIEHFPPDVTAIQFWLKNRQPLKWRDKPLESQDTTPPPTSVPVNVIDSSIPDTDENN